MSNSSPLSLQSHIVNLFPACPWLWHGEPPIKISLIAGHLVLFLNKLLVKCQLSFHHQVRPSWVDIWRKQSHCWWSLHSNLVLAQLIVGCLWSIDRSQTSFKSLTVFLNLTQCCETSSIDTDVAISACAITMVVNSSWFQNWGWWSILLLSVEGCDWACWNRMIRLVESSVVILNKCVSACSISKVVGPECVWLYLSARDKLTVLCLEHLVVRNTVDSWVV